MYRTVCCAQQRTKKGVTLSVKGVFLPEGRGGMEGKRDSDAQFDSEREKGLSLFDFVEGGI